MSPTPSNRADRVFNEALDLPLETREVYLLDACGRDAVLLAEAQALLAAHDAAPTGGFDSPAVEPVTEGDLDPTLAADGSGKNKRKMKTKGRVTSDVRW